jgi:hypothetical protein
MTIRISFSDTTVRIAVEINGAIESKVVELPQRTWVGLMRGVRVDGDTVVITVKGGNDAARELCGDLLNEMEAYCGND